MTTYETAPAVQADARNRAWRTLAQGLLFDVAAAVLLALAPMLWSEDFAFTGAYWTALAGLAAKTAIMATASYFMRRLMPPGDLPAGAVSTTAHQAAHRAELVDREALAAEVRRQDQTGRTPY